MSPYSRTSRSPKPGVVEPDTRNAGGLDSVPDVEPTGRRVETGAALRGAAGRAEARLLVYAAVVAWPVSVIAELTGLGGGDIPSALGFLEYWTMLGIIAAAGVTLRLRRT